MDENKFMGCLLGAAVGDAIGLPVEGLAPERAQRLFGPLTQHRLFLGRGFVSDDTAHALMTAQALVASGGEPERFGRELACRLRLWFLSLPPGVGLATARACLKLLVGFSYKNAGVFSAGNGPAMRAPIIGLFCAADPDDTRLRALVRVSTRLTHTDPQAEEGALAIARATTSSPFAARNERLPEGVASCASWGRPVSGYIVHTVAAALALTARHPDNLRDAVIETVALGGDTDTVAAIVGGLVGAWVGRDGIPTDWLAGLIEPWWSEQRIAKLARQCAEVAASRTPQRPDRNFWLATHTLLWPIVLFHGFRRLFPPY
ncbi:ADP-ribosylglycohydrolase family protein [Armatimonas rosea]|uniref:ADP-ribosylglycohydrolase n=1 Tax=Armatimonas rosea TaxID=685828 RepID=A0A7W9W542_ARMRO|nr:ADP-ribosylglycohydrolase family protein [Armatimonas rosea]MBB6048676.1 ADP-ribosylglycohydrolase [Armatimonas rosea]